MVSQPEEYEYSGHRAYIGIDRTGLVDSEPVLRHFGASEKRAVEVYRGFVEAALAGKSQEEYYRAAEGRLLGSEEFLNEVSHRAGERRSSRESLSGVSIELLLKAWARSSGLSREE